MKRITQRLGIRSGKMKIKELKVPYPPLNGLNLDFTKGEEERISP